MADFLTRLVQRTLESTPQVRPLLAPIYAPGPPSPMIESLEAEAGAPATLEGAPPVSRMQRDPPRTAGVTRFEARRGAEISHVAHPRLSEARQPDAPGGMEAEPAAAPAAPRPGPEAPVLPLEATVTIPPERPARHDTLPPSRVIRETEARAAAPASPSRAGAVLVSAGPEFEKGLAARGPEAGPSAPPVGPKAALPEAPPDRRPGVPSETPQPRPGEATTAEAGRRSGPVTPRMQAPRRIVEGASFRESGSGHAPVTRAVERVRPGEKVRAAFPDRPIAPAEDAELTRGAAAVGAHPAIAARPDPSRERRPPPAEGALAPAIRVTIGRVEVRAVIPPAPTPPPGAAHPLPALSLDGYLKQRNGTPR